MIIMHVQPVYHALAALPVFECTWTLWACLMSHSNHERVLWQLVKKASQSLIKGFSSEVSERAATVIAFMKPHCDISDSTGLNICAIARLGQAARHGLMVTALCYVIFCLQLQNC